MIPKWRMLYGTFRTRKEESRAMNRIERGFTMIAALLCMASSQAADEYSGKQAGSATRYTFSWPLDANAVAPRGGTTKGPPVTLDREPSKQWSELRAEGISAFE